jgi:hypothetical protein
MTNQTADEDKCKLYIAQRDEFLKKKESLLAEISKHKAAASELEERIENERPKTENGKMVCDHCDCISMEYLGRTPRGGLSGGDDIYKCEICGKYNN